MATEVTRAGGRRAVESTIEDGYSKDEYKDDYKPSNVALVALLYGTCSRRLSEFRGRLEKTCLSKSVVFERFRNESKRFRLFGAGFEDGRRLKFCLEDEELCITLLDLLLNIALILGKHRAASDKSLQPLIDRARVALGARADDEQSGDSEDDESDGVKTLSRDSAEKLQSLASMNHRISMLMELLPTLCVAYYLEHTVHSAETAVNPVSVSPEAVLYVREVQDKFPHISAPLADRLGQANWEGHERLRNMEREQLSFADTAHAPNHACALFQPATTFEVPVPGSSLLNDSENEAPIAAHPSFLNQSGGDKNGSLTNKHGVPLRFKDVRSIEPLPCLWCRSTIDLSNQIDWKIHPYSHFRPYICTWEACPESSTTFDTRKAWAQHETDHHFFRHVYRCVVCHEHYEEEQEYMRHMENFHQMDIPLAMRQTLTSLTRIRLPQDPSHVACNLCQERGFHDKSAYSTHVGRHLELIALTGLSPPDDVVNEEKIQSENMDTKNSRLLHKQPTDERLNSSLGWGSQHKALRSHATQVDTSKTTREIDEKDKLADPALVSQVMAGDSKWQLPKPDQRRPISGCSTCRVRRVACDLQTPVCVRCRKAGRECIFPKSPSANQSQQTQPLREHSASRTNVQKICPQSFSRSRPTLPR